MPPQEKSGGTSLLTCLPSANFVLCLAQGWPQTIAALQKGLVADGPVTLVLERRLRGDAAAAAAAGSTAVSGAGGQEPQRA